MEMHTDLHNPSTVNSSLRKSIGDPPTSAMPTNEGGVKLFGVRLTEGLMMRKAVSMGNLSCYSSTSSSLLPPRSSTPEHSESGDPHGYVSDGLVQNSGSLRERKKGVPWTEDEHRMFLVGLQKLGKGDWRGISRNFVPSRTPTQVASHAQKYFLRQINLNKRKRRSSLFDIISSNSAVSNCNTSNLNSGEPNSKLSFNLAAPMPPLDTPIATLETTPLSVTSLQSGISSNLCLGRALDSCQKPQQGWFHMSTNAAGAHASSSTLLSPLSLMSQRPSSKGEITRPTVAMASSSPRASSSITSLCRIDETTDPSANLRLSIGPPLLLAPMELSLKLEQPASRHNAALTGTNNNGNTLTNCIRVV